MFDDLSLFIKIIDFGSYRRASTELNLYQSKISRRMQSLEDMLGVKLFKKNTTKMELTDNGEVAYNMFKNLFNSLKSKLEDFSALSKTVSGKVKVILPPLFAQMYVNHRISELVAKYPHIELNLSYLALNETELDSFEYDLAISHIPPSKPYHIQKVLFDTKLILVASKNYINKSAEILILQDLVHHQIITVYESNSQLCVYDERKGSKQNCTLEKGVINLNCWGAALDMLKLGNGLVFLPECAVEKEINAGTVIRVLPDLHFGEIKYYLIQTNHYTSIKLEAVKSFLYDCVLQKNEDDNKIKLSTTKYIRPKKLNLPIPAANSNTLQFCQ